MAAKGTKLRPRIPENTEEKVQTLEIEQSILETQPQGAEPYEKLTLNQDQSTIAKLSDKLASRMNPNKSINNNKGRSTPVEHTKFGTPILNSYQKTSLRTSAEINEVNPEQRYKYNFQYNIREGQSSQIKQQQPEQKNEKRNFRTKDKKTNSQESGIVDLQDSDNEGELKKVIQTQGNPSPSKLDQNKISQNMDRKKSPNSIKKQHERVPLVLGSGLGNWTMKPVLLTRDYDTPQNKRIQNVSPDIKSKRATPQPTKYSDKLKMNSQGRLNKNRRYDPSQRKED